MKICLTVNSSPWSKFKGGGQIAVHQLACALKDKGADVHVLYSKGVDENPTPDVPYKIHWTRHYDFATVNLNIFSFARALEYLAKVEQFDIIHGNAEEAFFADTICRQNKSSFVFTSHTPHIPQTGMMRGMLNPIQFLKSVNSHLLRSTASRAQRIITFSQFSRGLVIRGLGRSAENKVVVIPPGIDDSWFKARHQIVNNLDLIFWGRVEEEKGLTELFQAVKNLSHKFPSVRLAVLGEGNQLENYKRRVAEMGLSDRMSFPGWQCSGLIQQAASVSIAAVFPSRVESFGLSVAEAQTMGIPIVAARAGAIPETVEDGKTGTLVPPRDAEALTQALEALFTNPNHFEERALRGQAAAHDRFSWSRAAERTLELYQQVLNS